MTDTRYLVHGVFWDGPPAVSAASDGGRPVLRLQHRSGAFTEMTLDAGTRLGFRVADGAKHCLGHTRVFSATERRHVTCPASADAFRGSQCGACQLADDTAALMDPLPGDELELLNRSRAEDVRTLLAGTAVGGLPSGC
ncbi:hypothetical protein [Arthrobacter globiformis]|uniref:hypothetical protein n=1 Tax=Arthrobacter globiformis TaxID=1665 RepID=UPI0027841718|nr:hypothetical protein [Arthrobacter globiformis]MDQ0866324.1 hypothetical protein [Arthrobacter globiformis]